jgi:hypothetical protein
MRAVRGMLRHGLTVQGLRDFIIGMVGCNSECSVGSVCWPISLSLSLSLSLLSSLSLSLSLSLLSLSLSLSLSLLSLSIHLSVYLSICLSISIHQGSSKANVHMEWDKLWAYNRKVIDPSAPRHTALTRAGLVHVTVEGLGAVEEKDVNLHPKNAAIGTKRVRVISMHAFPAPSPPPPPCMWLLLALKPRTSHAAQVWYSNSILLEAEDANTLQQGETVTLMDWGNVVVTHVERVATCVSLPRFGSDSAFFSLSLLLKVPHLALTCASPHRSSP